MMLLLASTLLICTAVSQVEGDAASQPAHSAEPLSLSSQPAASAPASQPSRALDSPFDSPPFPSADYLGPVIGAPDTSSDYFLMKALKATPAKTFLEDSRIKAYGWVNGSFNLSTSEYSNLPVGYDVVPNRPEVNQFVFRVERVPDTVQTNCLDWGFRVTNLYGIDYRSTIAKGWFSRQLLQKNELYGEDIPEAYFVLYVPSVAEGMTLKIGRYFSPADIESTTAVDNYLHTHSLMNSLEPVTFTGVLADIRLSKYWVLELGAHAGSDMTPWDHGALNGHAMLRWVSESNKDSIFAGVNSVGSGKYRDDHDNLQQIVGTWTHKFNDKVHMATQAYWMWQRAAFLGGSVNYGPVRRFGGGGGPGWVEEGTTDSLAAVHFINFELSKQDYISIRNEYLWDDQGQRTGLRNSYTSHTLGWGHQLTDFATIRPEVRYDHAYNLPAFDNGNRHSQFMFSVDLIIRF